MILKKILFGLFVLILTWFNKNANAQQLSLQINTGLMNYGGDLQAQFFTFKESKLTAGATVMYQVKNFGLRAGFTYGSVKGNDMDTKQLENRHLNFRSTITEANFCLQYDFFAADKDRKLIPYLFAGIGIYHFNPYTFYNSQKVYLQPLGTEGEGLSIYPERKMYSLTNFEDPFGIGVKYKLSSNLLIGIEFNSRLLYSDYLDDVSKTYPDENELFKGHGQLAVDLSFRGDEIDPAAPYPQGKKRGNPHQNDNYYTSVVTLTYIFSDRALFGNSFGHAGHSINCPKKVQ